MLVALNDYAIQTQGALEEVKDKYNVSNLVLFKCQEWDYRTPGVISKSSDSDIEVQ
jgi:hypothetical protein